jgi:hypothetical protein
MNYTQQVPFCKQPHWIMATLAEPALSSKSDHLQEKEQWPPDTPHFHFTFA